MTSTAETGSRREGASESKIVKVEPIIVAEEVLEESEAAGVQAAIATGRFVPSGQRSHVQQTVVGSEQHPIIHLHDPHMALEGLVQDERAESNQNGHTMVLNLNRMHVCTMLRNEGRTPTWPALFDQVLEEEDGIAFAGVCSSLSVALRLKELYEDETVTQYRAKSTVATFGNTEFLRTNLRRATFRLMDVRLYSPIFILAKNRYVCHKGPDIDKGLKERRKKANAAGGTAVITEDDDAQVLLAKIKDKRRKGFGDGGLKSKKPRLCQPTKKVGCPATLTMYEVLITNCEDADFDDELSWKVRIQTQEIELQRFIVIFLPHYHEGHAIGQSTASGVTRSWHPDVRARLTSLLEDGIRDPDEMMRHLKAFVEHKLCVDYATKPSTDDRRYYPLRTDVRNAMSYDLKEKKVTTRTDQDHLATLVQRWSTADPNGHVIFRPYMQTESGEEQNLLLVHQSSNQQYLMQRYGNEVVFLDNTPSYGIPLYLLSVKTNYSFLVVATFWLNVDSEDMVAEALRIVKSWNPDIEPRFAMCDNDEKQFVALQSTWPGTQLLLCDFSREQDWMRWLSQEDNGLQQAKSHILGLLRKIANADTEDQYVEAQRRLTTDVVYTSNGQLQNYFGVVYAPIADRWVRWYRQSMLIRADASSANERKINILKKHQQRNMAVSLTSAAETVKQINEGMWQDYCKANLTDSSSYKPYDLDDPVLHLANRPTGFRDRQIKSQQNSALFLELCSDIPSYFKRLETGVFLVKSFTSSSDDWHRVDFGSDDAVPSCSCSTFRKHKMPCQHFYAIFSIFEDVSWTNLPASYRDMPYFVLDPKCLEANGSQIRTTTTTAGGTVASVVKVESDALRKVNIYRLQGLLDRLKTSAYLVDDRNLDSCLQQVETVVNFVEKVVPDNGQSSLSIADEAQLSADSIVDELSAKPTGSMIPVVWDQRKHGTEGRTVLEGGQQVAMENGEIASQRMLVGKRRVSKKVRESSLATQREKQRQFVASTASGSPVSMETVSSDDVWVRCGNVMLTARHKAMLVEELDDTIIAAALRLLKREDKDNTLSGLLSPCLVASLQFEGQHAENMVQIIATSGTHVGHWICISTVGMKPGTVAVYDSLVPTNVNQDDTYSHFVKTQIAALLTLPIDDKQIVMQVVPCVQQEGSLACGLFAIAFATDLVYYRKIVGIPDQSHLASHLESCFTSGRLTPFPKRSSVFGVLLSRKLTIAIPIFCICRLPYSENRDCEEDLMVKCSDDECSVEWYHLRCVGRSEADRKRVKESQWFCERCSN